MYLVVLINSECFLFYLKHVIFLCREHTDPAVYLTAISKLHLMMWQVVCIICENDFKGLLSNSIILIRVLLWASFKKLICFWFFLCSFIVLTYSELNCMHDISATASYFILVILNIIVPLPSPDVYFQISLPCRICFLLGRCCIRTDSLQE